MSRCQAAVVQLAVFLGGGVFGPVWHLAHHRNDHSHGTDGQAPLEGVDDIHTHPSAPRTFRIALVASF